MLKNTRRGVQPGRATPYGSPKFRRKWTKNEDSPGGGTGPPYIENSYLLKKIATPRRIKGKGLTERKMGMTQVQVRSRSFPRIRTIIAPRCQLKQCKSPLTDLIRARKSVTIIPTKQTASKRCRGGGRELRNNASE